MRPWLLPYAPAAVGAARHRLPVRFVEPAALPAGEAYESFISRTGCVPTRPNRHDHFNRLVWLAFPALKQRLNALHAAEIAAQGVGPKRGALRDALTLFDEFGAVWADAPADLTAALRARDWQHLFVTLRHRWADTRPPVIVGHALLEQLEAAPRAGLTAHLLLADPLTLSAEEWAAKPFVPLPVLGIPGWWPANQDPAFYGDKTVFRPGPALKTAHRP
jgi:Protein of unknown function (DUF3025)